MIPKMLLGFLLGFVLRQIEKFQERIDWDLVKKDWDERLRKLVPGDWLDDELIALLNLIIDALSRSLGDAEALKGILTLLSEGNWLDALLALKDLFLKAFTKNDIEEDPQKKRIHNMMESLIG